MKKYLPLAILLIAQSLISQEFEVNGKVTNEDGVPLSSATVYMEKVSDSTLVTYTISDKDGGFNLSGKSNEPKIDLYISYAGYQPYRRTIELQREMDLKNIIMKVQDNQLNEILITALRSPITLKKDTLEFNAGSFTTRPDANLEELLKQLPGVEVDTEGNITVNGKPVSRFLVNGEEFFGSDHRIATKNLPKEIINKIQVVDTKTEAQQFTGEPGDPDNKTINITIQEDKNKGYFARATAGGGTDERYELSTILNYFKDDFRVSALASSNNINSSGFSYDEVYGMMGRSAGRNVFGGSGGGITKAEIAGINFVNKWDDLTRMEEIEVNGEYFFGRNDTERRTIVARENILVQDPEEELLPDSRYYTNSDDRSNLLNDSHRANFEIELELDTLTRISVNPRFNANYGTSNRYRMEESLDENSNLVNNTETVQNEKLTREDISNEIDFIRRFGKRGAFLRAEFSNDHSRQNNDNFYYSESLFFEDGVEDLRIQDQYIDEDENEDEYSLELRQRSVLIDDLFLDLSYDFDYSNSTNKRYVYEAENGDGIYNTVNDLLSNAFQVTSKRHRPNAGLNYEGEVWRVNTDVGLLHTRLENENLLQDVAFDNEYNNLFINARVRYEIERSKNLSLRYSTNADIPNIRQLQPVVDRTNPLHIVQGNPALRPTYRQNFNFDFRNFDFATRSGYSAWFNMNFTENNVVPVTIIDDNFIRYTTYTNMDGARGANAGAIYNKQIKDGITEFRYHVRMNSSYNRNVGFINGVQYEADRYSVNPSIRFTYAMEEYFDISPNYSLDYSSSTYNLSSDRDQEITNHRVGLQVTTYWPKNVIFGNDISYYYAGNVAPGFDNNSILWNLSLGYQFWDEDATLKVQVYDLLDQNVDTRRTIGDDYIQDTQSLILTRYAMLSFTYKLNKFGGRQQDENRRGGRGR